MEIKILEEKINAEELKVFAKTWYLNFLKGCVDLVNKKVAVGGEYHIESAQLLVTQGGHGKDIWGFNIRYNDDGKNIIEFDSMVNIKPNTNNSRIVSDEILQEEIRKLIEEYIVI